jgi:hypothetical protein
VWCGVQTKMAVCPFCTARIVPQITAAVSHDQIEQTLCQMICIVTSHLHLSPSEL